MAKTRGTGLLMVWTDVDPEFEAEFNRWYNTAYIPGYLAVPGCLGARRFIVVEGQPKYLTVYEFEHARVSETEAWSRARSSNPWTRRVQPNLRHDDGSLGVYQRIYPSFRSTERASNVRPPRPGV
jgi:hypothetical protein